MSITSAICQRQGQLFSILLQCSTRRARDPPGLMRHFSSKPRNHSSTAVGSRNHTSTAVGARNYTSTAVGSRNHSSTAVDPTIKRHAPVTVSSSKVKLFKTQPEMLEITWSDDDVTKFPYVWLRDCCLCDQCYVYTAKARKLVMQSLDPDITPQDIQIDENAGKIQITWKGGHQSKFSFEWLRQRAYNEKLLKTREKWLPPKAETWGRHMMQDNIPTETFDNIIRDDHALFNWLYELEKKGIFLIKDSPTTIGQVEKLGKRVAFLRTTNYGVKFTVKAKSDASNAAYTSAALGLHTDVPFYEYIPGVQMLHCITQTPTPGGDNQFADGFFIAERMRQEKPDYFRILTETPIDFYDVGTDNYKFYLLRLGPTIKLNRSGNVVGIAYNNQDRDYQLSLPPDQVKPLYSALRYFDDMLYRPDNHIEHKLNEGEIVCVNNHRVMHGRSAFDMISGVERHLEGGYLDWDEVSSRRRVLQYDLHLDDHPPIY